MSKTARCRSNAEASSSTASPGMQYLQKATFAQALMERTWMKEQEAKQLFLQITGTRSDHAYMAMVASVDADLMGFSFKLTRLLFPLDRTWYLAVVNKTSDEAAKTLGSHFTPAQIAFLKSVVEAIALDPDAEGGIATIGSMDANNLASTFSQTQATQCGSQAAGPRLTMTQKEKALEEFAEDGWLAAVPGRPGTYSLGVRSFLELKDFLHGLELPADTRQAWERFL
ncbi:hypothetical protein CVIRNUC_009783 [Coccomyxa viridis]|uniref:Non-structural maintenance of chromosomes element 1 homolog n=1 Tax=Coccomyxa viridis TaxID=1274662 RepID=A0AAV1IK28_9CHLO|nr:hypothetical protein CVIRNUC_009783 [Coccomyxa viridis]